MSVQEAAALFQTALGLHRNGQVGLAESHYLRVVKLMPKHAEAWHLLGVIAYQSGKLAKSVKQFRQAVAAHPGFAQAWNNLALALQAGGDRDAARDAFGRALALRPEYVEAAYNLGLLHRDSGDFAAAESAWRQVLRWQAGHVPTLTNLGNLLRARQRYDDAATLLQYADQCAPSADTALNLGLLALDRGEAALAGELAAEALRRDPRLIDALELQGVAARIAADVPTALKALEATVVREPLRAGAWLELGLARGAAGDWPAARSALAKAGKIEPRSARALWQHALALPALPADDAETIDALAAFADGVARLRERIGRAPAAELREHLEAAATVAPFYLAYLTNDPTVQLARFGDLLDALVTRCLPELAVAPVSRPRPGRRLRVAFVSSYWTRHTVSRYFAGFATGLPRGRFEVAVWHTGASSDEDSATTAAAVDRFVQAHEGVVDLAQRIRATEPDIAVFPDVGMDPRQHLLAALRLAPRQVALYGHPITTGLAAVDVFFSGAALEPRDAQAFYRERLLALPGLGATPTRWAALPESASLRERTAGRPILLCPQLLGKLTPDFDQVLVRILGARDACLVLFDREGPLSKRYLQRLTKAAALQGVDLDDRIVLMGAVSYPRFLGALREADLVLDTPRFSGGGTSLDAFALGVPVLAHAGDTARARQTCAMLEQMEIGGLIAADSDRYVERALGLLADRAQHRELGMAIQARSEMLFADSQPLIAFADRLEELVLTSA